VQFGAVESRGADKTATSNGLRGEQHLLISIDGCDSSIGMIRDRTIRARERLLGKLPVTGELLRGSLLDRTVWHRNGCPKCARGEGHRVFVLTVSYAGGRTQQLSVRRERVDEVRRWLDNYQKLKEAIEEICELNHDLLRPTAGASKRGRKARD
jgi:hypothetical protein